MFDHLMFDQLVKSRWLRTNLSIVCLLLTLTSERELFAQNANLVVDVKRAWLDANSGYLRLELTRMVGRPATQKS